MMTRHHIFFEVLLVNARLLRVRRRLWPLLLPLPGLLFIMIFIIIIIMIMTSCSLGITSMMQILMLRMAMTTRWRISPFPRPSSPRSPRPPSPPPLSPPCLSLPEQNRRRHLHHLLHHDMFDISNTGSSIFLSLSPTGASTAVSPGILTHSSKKTRPVFRISKHLLLRRILFLAFELYKCREQSHKSN